MNTRLKAGFGAALVTVSAASAAFGALQGRYLHEMTGEYVTPHFPFRGSEAEKPLRALFLLDRKGGRDAVELVQRFAVEPTYFLMTTGRNRIATETMYESAWAGTTFYEKTRELDAKLTEAYDVYVFGRKDFTCVTEEHRYRILKAVRDEGAGLLIVSDDAVAKMPYSKVYGEKLPTPEFAEKFPSVYRNTRLAGYRLGKGRVVELSWKGPPSPYFSLVPKFRVDDLWPAKYENAIAFAGMAMRYAAGRNEKPSEPVRTRIRNRFNAEVGDASCAGVHYRDTLGANGAVTVEKVETPSPVGGLAVEAPETVRPGEGFTVKASWATPCAAAAKVRIETLESPSLRVMTRRTVGIGEGQTAVSAEIPDARIGTKAGYVRATLEDANGRALEVAETVQFFPVRYREDYMNLGWDTVLGMHPFAGAPLLVDRLGFHLGLTHPTEGGGNIREMALLNQHAVIYTTRIGIVAAVNGSSRMEHLAKFLDGEGQKALKELKGDACFYRPEVQALWRRMIRHRLENLPKCAPAIYSLGDENHMDAGCGFGEYDDRYFRAFLEEKYGTIENLNRNWRTNLTAFAEVPHLRPKVAKAIGNLAAWGDHRAYIEKMYADMHDFCRNEIRTYDPGAPVGAEGSVPGDLELTIAEQEYWGPYSSLVGDEVLRSLGGDRIRALWWGGYPSSHGGRGATPFPVPLMKDLVRGTINGSAWFDVSVGQNHGFFYSDLKPADDVAAYLGWHDRFTDGLAQLLVRNPLVDEGIFLYRSHPSSRAAIASERFLSPGDGQATLIKSLYRTGRTFEFVSARTLGRLAHAQVVFLCGCTALSDAEVAALRAYAGRGGRLVADTMPAVLNENLCPREASPLADLFGKGPSVLLDRKLSLAQAQEKTPGDFDREIAALLPRPVACVPGARMEEGAVLRTRRGPGFDLVAAFWPATNLGAKVPVRLPGRRFAYDPMVGFAGEAENLELDFGKSPFVCRTLFRERQQAPAFAIGDTAPGGEVKFTPPPLADGRVYGLKVTDAAGAVRWKRTFDREGNLPRRMFVGPDEKPGNWTATLVDCATGLRTTKTFRVGK